MVGSFQVSNKDLEVYGHLRVKIYWKNLIDLDTGLF